MILNKVTKMNPKQIMAWHHFMKLVSWIIFKWPPKDVWASLQSSSCDNNNQYRICIRPNLWGQTFGGKPLGANLWGKPLGENLWGKTFGGKPLGAKESDGAEENKNIPTVLKIIMEENSWPLKSKEVFYTSFVNVNF